MTSRSWGTTYSTLWVLGSADNDADPSDRPLQPGISLVGTAWRSKACEVLIGGRTYPVRGGVNSAHTIVDIGEQKTVEVGDVATLIGPDHAAILPHTIAEQTGTGFLALIQSMNPRLPRRVV